MPDHCFEGSQIVNPYNIISFSVIFNSISSINTYIGNQTDLDPAICFQNNTADSMIPVNYFYNSIGNASMDNIVGIAINGVPLYNGLSTSNVDMLYP